MITVMKIIRTNRFLEQKISVNGMNGKRSWKESLYLVSLSGQVWIILVKLDVVTHGLLKEPAVD